MTHWYYDKYQHQWPAVVAALRRVYGDNAIGQTLQGRPLGEIAKVVSSIAVTPNP